MCVKDGVTDIGIISPMCGYKFNQWGTCIVSVVFVGMCIVNVVFIHWHYLNRFFISSYFFIGILSVYIIT